MGYRACVCKELMFSAVLLLGAGCASPAGTPEADGSSSTGTTPPVGTASSNAATTGGSTETTAAPGASSGTSSTSASSDTSQSGTASSTGTTGNASICDGGSFPDAWPDGTACPEDTFTVHRYSENTFILRQSLCTGFEGPFLYLMFGQDRVLLEDTGYAGAQVAPVVYGLIDTWLAERGRESIELVVANSHGHGDHVGGNSQFVGMPNTTVVGFDVPSISSFVGIQNWREDIVAYDLGGRVLDVIPIPGHQSAHIALYDHGDGLLLTGDTLYPGRLYISSFDAYVASIDRMVTRLADEEVCHVLGTHIEMTDQPGVDFRFGADQHPGERELQLSFEHLVELRDAVAAMGTPQQEVHDDFIIFPL